MGSLHILYVVSYIKAIPTFDFHLSENGEQGSGIRFLRYSCKRTLNMREWDVCQVVPKQKFYHIVGLVLVDCQAAAIVSKPTQHFFNS